MPKDPAINWYFDNWNGGTKGFSRHQKGCYMDLLESQFYLGHLSLEQVKNILGPDFSQWNFLSDKFSKDEQGNFFNERMELEKNKRMKYSKSRSANRSGKKHINNTSTTYEKHINNIPETGIETDNEIKKTNGVNPEKPTIKLIPQEPIPEYLQDWQRWANQIVAQQDQYWQQMKGPTITQTMMDHFMSVATRNSWAMDTAQEFRTSLKGFDFKSFTGAKPELKKVHTL